MRHCLAQLPKLAPCRLKHCDARLKGAAGARNQAQEGPSTAPASAGYATRRWYTRSFSTMCGLLPVAQSPSQASSAADGGVEDQDGDGSMADDPQSPPASSAVGPAGHVEESAASAVGTAAPPAEPSAPPPEEHPQPDVPLAADMPAHPLLPSMLLTAQLAAAESFAAAQQLLTAHAAALGTIHLLAALSRMGFLALDAKQPAGQGERAAFGSLRDRAIGALEAEGNLTTSMCCHLLLASARLRLPLEHPQLAAVEAALVCGLPAADSMQVGQLLSSFSWLGMLPGSRLAAALAQAQQQRRSFASELPKPDTTAAVSAEAVTTGADEVRRDLLCCIVSCPGAGAAAANRPKPCHRLLLHACAALPGCRQPQKKPSRRLAARQSGQLSLLCWLAGEQQQQQQPEQPPRYHVRGQAAYAQSPPASPVIPAEQPPPPAELLRSPNALPPADEAAAAGSPSMLATLVAMAQLLREAGRPPTQQERAAFGGLRGIALRDFEQGGAGLPGCCQLLQASARAEVPLAPQEQAAIEAAAVPCLLAAEASPWQLLQLWSAYTQLGMQPGSAMAAALVEAAEPCIEAGASPVTPGPASAASEVRLGGAGRRGAAVPRVGSKRPCGQGHTPSLVSLTAAPALLLPLLCCCPTTAGDLQHRRQPLGQPDSQRCCYGSGGGAGGGAPAGAARHPRCAGQAASSPEIGGECRGR